MQYETPVVECIVQSWTMAAARLVVSGGRIASAAIAVGACAPVAVRLGEIEAALHVLACSEAVPWLRDNMAGIMAALSPIDDVRGTAGYRREAAAELVTRLVGRLCGDTP